ncbi:hypothetical protein [Terrimonas ferruginea]|uniref:hypothetical protein n=1 Tax=Terrimonas ferruginea TaxID=249 RepID=UPI00041749B7|nr:hypothetical protein [Terrimonas ferruginea]
MNKLFLAALMIVTVAFVACGADDAAKNLQAKSQALYDSVIKGHDVGMAKMRALGNARERTKQLIDSIDKLPAQAKEAAAELRARLSGLGDELAAAEKNMYEWMAQINLDTFNNDIKEKIRYYTSENEKTTRIKNDILGSLAKADSVLKERF